VSGVATGGESGVAVGGSGGSAGAALGVGGQSGSSSLLMSRYCLVSGCEAGIFRLDPIDLAC
jgi:hypothetical protein